MFYKTVYNDDILLQKLRSALYNKPIVLAKATDLWDRKFLLVQYLYDLILSIRDIDEFDEQSIRELMLIHNEFSTTKLFQVIEKHEQNIHYDERTQQHTNGC
jgi:hypothetical protein